MKKEIKTLIQRQTSRNMAAKFYIEQLPGGDDELINAVKTTSSSDRWLVAIKHTNTKDKPHWHFMDLSKEKKGFNVGGELHRFGIYFRPGTDDALMKNRGLETLGSFDSYLGYVLHTDEKSQNLNKEPYSLDDIVSNLPQEELQKILDGRPTKMKKLSSAEQIEIARKAGYESKGFYTVANTVGISGLGPLVEKKLRNAYEAGAFQRMKEHLMVNRLCVEIQTNRGGDKGISNEKVFSAVQVALKGLELSVSRFGDDIVFDSTTDGIITQECPDSFAREYIISIASDNHKPNKKSLWTGRYLIYVNGYKEGHESKNCFVCQIKNKKLICIFAPSLTGDERSVAIGEMYKEFRDKFNESYNKNSSDMKAHSLDLDYLNS